jgi:hypothetical protein
MSASTTTPVSSVAAQTSDNQFKLRDYENKTTVTLNLQKPGPLTPGTTGQGPSLDYHGVEGTLSFSGPQIITETTALGKMFTVTLNIVPDLRTLTFSLLIPAVIHKAGEASQAFETIAVKAEHHTSLTGTPNITGANPTYHVLKMHGTAASVKVPF